MDTEADTEMSSQPNVNITHSPFFASLHTDYRTLKLMMRGYALFIPSLARSVIQSTMVKLPGRKRE